MPKALRGVSHQGRLAGAQQSPTPTDQTESPSRCPNYGSETKASPRNVSFCSLLLASKFSMHMQALKAIQLLPNTEQLLLFSNRQNKKKTKQKENLFPYTGSISSIFQEEELITSPSATPSRQTKQNAEAMAAAPADDVRPSLHSTESFGPCGIQDIIPTSSA